MNARKLELIGHYPDRYGARAVYEGDACYANPEYMKWRKSGGESPFDARDNTEPRERTLLQKTS